MICVSVVEPTVSACVRALRGIPFAEVRLDGVGDAREHLERLFASKTEIVATCRPGAWSGALRRELLLRAIAAGARWVDIELESPRAMRRDIVAAARRHGCRVIVSHHDLERTPTSKRLAALVERCFAAGADVAKVACRARGPADCARLLALLAGGDPVIPIGLGPEGRITRVAAPLLGAPFSYAALRADRPAGPGQLSRAELARILEWLAPGAGPRRAATGGRR